MRRSFPFLLAMFYIIFAIVDSCAGVIPVGKQKIDGADQNWADGGTTPNTLGVEYITNHTLFTTADAQDIAFIEVDTDGIGTLTTVGNTAIGGDVGGANYLNIINANGGTGKTLALGGDTYVKQLNFGGLGTVTIAGGKSIFYGTGTGITTSANNQGILSLLGSSTIYGPVGTSSNKLAEVKAGATGAIDTFNNDVFATTFTMVGNGTVNVAAGKSINSAVTSSNNGQGTVNFNGTTTLGGDLGTVGGNKLAAVNFNGDVTLDHNIAATLTTIKSGSTATLSGDRTINGNLTLNNSATSILDIGANTLTLSGTGIYTQNDNSKLKVAINGASSFGNIAASGNAVVGGSSALDISVGNYIANNATFKIIDSNGGLGVNAPGTITDNSSMVDFSASTSSGNLTLTATRVNTYNGAASGNSNGSAAGVALESAGSGGATGRYGNRLRRTR